MTTPLLKAACLFAAALAWLPTLAGCEWEPVARPVQPERILEGPAHLDRVLDVDNKYLLVTRGPRWSIVDWRKEQPIACDLPTQAVVAYGPLLGPLDRRDDPPAFLMPILVEQEGAQVLYYSDENCELRGPFGAVSGVLSVLSLDADSRHVTLFRDPDGTLHLVDPWQEAEIALAEEVQAFASVFGGASDRSGRQALWIIEGGKLTQRLLDGELLLSIGEGVTDFSQTYERVAFVQDGDLYEAGQPNFTPLFRHADACQPRYTPYGLDFFSPCEAQQLIRRDFFLGTEEEFEEGVYRVDLPASLPFQIEYARSAEGEEQMFVSAPGFERRQLPYLFSGFQNVGGTRYAVLASGVPWMGDPEDAPSGRTLGIWEATSNTFSSVFHGVSQLIPFSTFRSSLVAWLMHHDVREDFGTLSVAGQDQAAASIAGALTLHSFAENVPVGAFSIENRQTQPLYPYQESMFVYVADAVAAPDTRSGYRGTLHVALVSNNLDRALGDAIDVNVGSFRMVVTPIPGILYGVEEGPNAGLWFAAL